MVIKTPIFLLLANDKDVTDQLQKYVSSINFTDEAGTQSDSIKISINGGDFKRPSTNDELKLYLGYKNQSFFFAGTFKVQTSTRTRNQSLTISATGVDFSMELKQKKSATFQSLSLKDVCSSIAKYHGLKLKSDFDDCFIKHLLQTNESDLNFLTRLAVDYNAIFSIKNGTLIFIKRNKHNAINKDLPVFKIDASIVENLTIKHSNKLFYKSCMAKWHDTKLNQPKSVTAGADKPVVNITGAYKDEAEALLKAEAKLSTVNKGIISGSFDMDGIEIYAGGNMELINTINGEDDGIYSIKSVKHKFSPTGGWTVGVEFEN